MTYAENIILKFGLCIKIKPENFIDRSEQVLYSFYPKFYNIFTTRTLVTVTMFRVYLSEIFEYPSIRSTGFRRSPCD